MHAGPGLVLVRVGWQSEASPPRLSPYVLPVYTPVPFDDGQLAPEYTLFLRVRPLTWPYTESQPGH